jgi:beta-arrestin
MMVTVIDCFFVLSPVYRNSVRLAIRKIMYAPSKQGEQPSVEVSKEFMMSPNKLHLEASLDKELYYHGETVAINVHIQNNSNKSVKKVKVSGKSSIFFFFVISSLYKVVDDFPKFILPFSFKIPIIIFIRIWTMK